MNEDFSKKNIIRKQCSEKSFKEKGITLVALAVTIIVMLILAGVAIAQIKGKDGIVTNASNASIANTYYEAEEKVKLACMSMKSEMLKKKRENPNYDATTAENTAELGEILKKDLNDTNYWSVDYSTAGTIVVTYTNSLIKANVITTGKPSQDGKVEYVITLEKHNLRLAADGNNPVTPQNQTGINYGDKTASTVGVGDTIRIGDDPENRFMVLENNGSTIMAIAYYNITLDTENPQQIATYGNGEQSQFSTSRYWSEAGANIDMTNSKNIVQQYITAYSEKLKGITNNKVTAEIGKYNGENGISEFIGQSNSESKLLLNPGGTGDYWLGSSYTIGSGNVRFIASNR